MTVIARACDVTVSQQLRLVYAPTAPVAEVPHHARGAGDRDECHARYSEKSHKDWRHGRGLETRRRQPDKHWRGFVGGEVASLECGIVRLQVIDELAVGRCGWQHTEA